jgi:hypothetical protein
MDHEMVVLQKVTERYLLNELDSVARNEFEEHFFACAECAFDVRAGSAFVEQSRTVLAETPETESPLPARAIPAPPQRNWLSWLRPAFAAPALALLLAVVGYQNLVIYPRLSHELNSPQVLPWASINVGTFGEAGAEITAAPGKSFLMLVRIPPQSGYVQRTADLYNPAGKLEWSLPIPAAVSQGHWPVVVPGANRQAGAYTLVVRGTTPAGVSEELGRGSFELHIQN